MAILRSKEIWEMEDEVCDAMQEAMMSAYRNINQLTHEKYFKTWLIRITINKCYSIIEKNDSLHRSGKTALYGACSDCTAGADSAECQRQGG